MFYNENRFIAVLAYTYLIDEYFWAAFMVTFFPCFISHFLQSLEKNVLGFGNEIFMKLNGCPVIEIKEEEETCPCMI